MMPRNFFHLGRCLRSSLCGIGLTLSLAVSAQPPAGPQPNAQLRQAVDRFMTSYIGKLKARQAPKTRIEYSVAPFDNRLDVADCSQPLKIDTRDNLQPTARINLQVSCQPENWSIYLPVDLAMYRPVVVSVKPLTHGSTVGADDVQLAELNVSQLSGQYLSSLDEVIGKDVKRSITAGLPVQQSQLMPPLMVKRGEAVMIRATSSIVAVKVSGIALTDGRLGEQIRIKNQSSSRIVSATMVGPNLAEVAM